jgi:hypothetical protein
MRQARQGKIATFPYSPAREHIGEICLPCLPRFGQGGDPFEAGSLRNCVPEAVRRAGHLPFPTVFAGDHRIAKPAVLRNRLIRNAAIAPATTLLPLQRGDVNGIAGLNPPQ